MVSLQKKKAKGHIFIWSPQLAFWAFIIWSAIISALIDWKFDKFENSINLELLLKLDQNIWRDPFFRTAWQLLWQPRPLLQPFDLGVSQNKNRSLWFVKQDQDIILQKSCWQKSEVIILRRGTEEVLTTEIDSCLEKSEGGHKDQLTYCLNLW